MTLRHMVVVRSPSTDNRPEIRISNSFLLLAGFKIGTPIEVCYQQDRLIITKLNNHHAILNTTEAPNSLPSATYTPESAPYPSDRQPGPGVRTQALRFVSVGGHC